MNKNRKLSEKTYEKRQTQPHMPKSYATKKRKRFLTNEEKRAKLERIKNG